MTEELLVKFAEDYTRYTDACIAYAQMQDPQTSLSFDRDIAWIQQWMRDNVKI